MTEIIFLDETDSTNSYLKRRCNELSDGDIVTARLQTAGRGRRGHDWAADEGMLPLSILLKDPPDRDNLTARAGLAVCEAIEDVCKATPEPPKASIKWPNDIIIRSRKVCGILCECVFFGDCANVIVGIGVNVSQNEAFFKAAGLPSAASLLMLTGSAPDRGELLTAIAERVKIRAAMPFSDCYNEYRSRLLNLNKQIRIISANGERIAVAEDIAKNGFLICRDESGVFEVSSGEVSVRGIDGYL
ncbi:MAG: biotin--[acetyl-CoA-carboxylase] ligase [Oscillospiraceae bacterium]|nr:biotin--[acetyl-CoA-carboxylase] ligase [Oscillospiraceae bacterium]